VKARSLPPLDDDFATTVGTEYNSIDELRGAIRENLQAREEHERRVAHEEQVIQAVVDQATVDLPPQMIEEETDRLYQQTAQSLERQGIPLTSYLRLTQKSDEQFREELTAQAERNVRQVEVMNAIADAEGIAVTDDEIRAEVMASAENEGERNRLVRETMRRPQVKERIAAALQRQRAVRLLLETVGGVDFDALEATSADNEEDGDAATSVSADAANSETEPVTADESPAAASTTEAEAAPVEASAASDDTASAEQIPVAAEQSSKPIAKSPGETSA
jgi:trigger factor